MQQKQTAPSMESTWPSRKWRSLSPVSALKLLLIIGAGAFILAAALIAGEKAGADLSNTAKISIFFLFIAASVFFVSWLEIKITAFSQSRTGPASGNLINGLLSPAIMAFRMIVGPVQHRNVKGIYPLLAPAVTASAAVLGCAFIPFTQRLCLIRSDTGVLAIMATTTFCLPVIFSALSHKTIKHAVTFGAFEIVKMAAVMPSVMSAKSLDLAVLTARQSERWTVLAPVTGQISFIIFMAAVAAQMSVAPADTEQGQGWETDYEGAQKAVALFARRVYLVLSLLLAAVIFLGGWNPAFGPETQVSCGLWLFAKVTAMALAIFWMGVSFPSARLRHISAGAWRILIPAGLLNAILQGLILWQK